MRTKEDDFETAMVVVEGDELMWYLLEHHRGLKGFCYGNSFTRLRPVSSPPEQERGGLSLMIHRAHGVV